MSIFRHQSQTSPVAELTTFAVDMMRHRAEFLDRLNQLSDPFRGIATDHYLGRLVRAQGRHMLGEYVPFMMADLLDQPRNRAASMMVPWLLVYEYALLLDDTIDLDHPSKTDWLLCSQVVFGEAVTALGSAFKESPYLWQDFKRFHEQGLLAVAVEARRDRTSEAVLHPDTARICCSSGRKSALLKFCASAITVREQLTALSGQQEKALDALCSGVQWLDDLTDLAEDQASGRRSHALQSTLRWVRDTYPSQFLSDGDLPSEVLPYCVLLSGTFCEVVDLAVARLRECLGEFKSEETPTYKHLQSLAIGCEGAVSLVTRTLGEGELDQEALFSSLDRGESTDSFIENSPFKERWLRLRSIFESIATASN